MSNILQCDHQSWYCAVCCVLWDKPGVQLLVLIVNQEERSSVSIHQLLCLVHDLDYEGVHADHLLEDGPEKYIPNLLQRKHGKAST